MSSELKMDPQWLVEQRDQLLETVSRKNHDKLAMLLSNAHFDVINSEDFDMSPLNRATTKGDHVSVELLLAHGAIPDYKQPRHVWPGSTLYWAIMRNNHKVIQLLVSHGCDPDTELVEFSEDNGRRKSILFKIPITYWYKIVEYDNLPDFQLLLQCKGRKIIDDQWSQDMLMLACSFGSRAIIDYLLDQGVSTESIDKNGWTCLFFGVANRNIDVIELLLARGANTNHKDLKGRTALHIAELHQKDNNSSPVPKTKVIKLLIDHGADINATDVNGLTPINMAFTAKSVNHSAIWLLLRQRNIDLAKPDINGVTPLHRAVSFGYLLSHMKILVGLDVDINARDNGGKTPLQSIRNFNAIINIQFLLELGANSEDLYYYSKNGWLENNEFLKVLEKYRLKRRIANLSKDENVDKILARYCVFSEEEYAGLVKEFSREIGRMKETILFGKLTYYKFLHAKKRTCINVAKKPELYKTLTGLTHGFCNYAFMLCKNYLSGARPLAPTESKAMNNAEENLNFIFKNKLPNLVVYEIEKYMEIDDMLTLNNMNLFSLNDHKNNKN